MQLATGRQLVTHLKVWMCFVFPIFFLTGANVAPPSDHGDGHIGDYYVFTKGDKLVLAVTIVSYSPSDFTAFRFQNDVAYQYVIDRNPDVHFNDANAVKRYGGTINTPTNIADDVVIEIKFSEGSSAFQLETTGLYSTDKISVFAGLRDDPFIRGGLEGKNIAAIVVELPLSSVLTDKDNRTFLTWSTASLLKPKRQLHDHCGHPYRSQRMPELNTMHPKDHSKWLKVPPDVYIYNTAKPAAYPNGRALTDDVVDMLPDLITDNPPFPSKNDKDFLADFPYLATPHGYVVGRFPGPKNQQIYNAPLAVFNLEKEIGMKKKAVRVRYWIMAPGGYIGQHFHGKRPAIVFLLDGEVVETKLDPEGRLSVTRMGSDEVVLEPAGITHWWVNETKGMTKMVAVDLPDLDSVVVSEPQRVPRTTAFAGPTRTDNVKIEELGEHDFGKQFPEMANMKNYRMKGLRITMLPGQTTVLQKTTGQPSVAYVITGDILENRSDDATVGIKRGGDFSIYNNSVEYYWENPSSETAVIFLVSFVKVP